MSKFFVLCSFLACIQVHAKVITVFNREGDIDQHRNMASELASAEGGDIIYVNGLSSGLYLIVVQVDNKLFRERLLKCL